MKRKLVEDSSIETYGEGKSEKSEKVEKIKKKKRK